MSSPNLKKLLRNLLTGTKATTGFYGFGDFAANTDDIIGEIFTSPTYTDAERTRIAAFFAELDETGKVKRSIPVLSEYPRYVADLPAIFVFRRSDAESTPGLLGDLYEDYDEDLSTDFSHADKHGTHLTETVELHLWATGDGALRDDLYLAMRELVTRGRKYLIDGGVEIPQWGNGKDGQLYMEDVRPNIVHTAEATLTARVPLTWTESGEKNLDFKGNHTQYGGRVVALSFTDEP